MKCSLRTVAASALLSLLLPLSLFAEGEGLITKEYHIPPAFIDTAPAAQGSQTAVDALKKMGVEFPEGASAVYIPNGSRLVVRNTQTNLDLIDALIEVDAERPIVLSIQDEVYSIPAETALQLLESTASDAERYKKVRAMLKEKTARLERLCVMRTKPGERSITESIIEFRYVSEYEREFKQEGKAGAAESTKTKALSLETRNLGDTIELLPQLGANGIDVDIEIIPSRTNHVVDRGIGVDQLTQPILQTQKMQTKVTTQIGKPYLLGTLNPPFGDGISESKEQRVWLEFLTVSFPEI